MKKLRRFHRNKTLTLTPTKTTTRTPTKQTKDFLNFFALEKRMKNFM